jgi:hypothetical protein
MRIQPHTDELFSSSCQVYLFQNLLVWFLFDSTFFKEFHNGLARIIKLLLNKAGPSQAIFFSPKRGNSLDKFLETINQNGLFFSLTENYDPEVWKRHQEFMDCKNSSWSSYERDHCYPVMVRITIWTFCGCFPLCSTYFVDLLSSWPAFSIVSLPLC